jgi:hypothetical protein
LRLDVARKYWQSHVWVAGSGDIVWKWKWRMQVLDNELVGLSYQYGPVTRSPRQWAGHADQPLVVLILKAQTERPSVFRGYYDPPIRTARDRGWQNRNRARGTRTAHIDHTTA